MLDSWVPCSSVKVRHGVFGSFCAAWMTLNMRLLWGAWLAEFVGDAVLDPRGLKYMGMYRAYF